MKNRYNVEYNFKKISENTYLFDFPKEEMQYCRYGGMEGQNTIDFKALGFIDPSGGPFIGLGDKFKGQEIVRIFIGEDDKVYLEVQ